MQLLLLLLLSTIFYSSFLFYSETKKWIKIKVNQKDCYIPIRSTKPNKTKVTLIVKKLNILNVVKVLECLTF